MNIAKTERLTLRELKSNDAEFIFRLLNTPKFLKYIGDRGVRSVEQAADFIESRYRQSYTENGYGLYCVELADGVKAGLCGFVRRETLPAPDIGFAFLPEFEGIGLGSESAHAVMRYGREKLGFDRVLAITTLDNDASTSLLQKLGFTKSGTTESPEGETLNLFEFHYSGE